MRSFPQLDISESTVEKNDQIDVVFGGCRGCEVKLIWILLVSKAKKGRKKRFKLKGLIHLGIEIITAWKTQSQ